MAQDEKDVEEFTSVRIGREFSRRLAMIAQFRGESIAAMVERVCGPVVERELKKVLAEMTVTLGGES